MRENIRYDAVPFRPVTTAMKEDKPRLVVLADVSLSVRGTSQFTLHLVHGLQSLFAQVRTFAFVADLVEITDLFDEHPLEHALGLVFGGEVLDVDATSDYGAALGQFREEYSSAVNRRSTLLVLGDGRGNGNDPNLDAFAEITRRAKSTLWLTPEPQYSWSLGRCDLPLYADLCDKVEVVRDLSGLTGLRTRWLRWSAVLADAGVQGPVPAAGQRRQPVDPLAGHVRAVATEDGPVRTDGPHGRRVDGPVLRLLVGGRVRDDEVGVVPAQHRLDGLGQLLGTLGQLGHRARAEPFDVAAMGSYGQGPARPGPPTERLAQPDDQANDGEKPRHVEHDEPGRDNSRPLLDPVVYPGDEVGRHEPAGGRQRHRLDQGGVA